MSITILGSFSLSSIIVPSSNSAQTVISSIVTGIILPVIFNTLLRFSIDVDKSTNADCIDCKKDSPNGSLFLAILDFKIVSISSSFLAKAAIPSNMYCLLYPEVSTIAVILSV